MRGVILILAASLSLGACADTSQFQKPITAFATASASASTAITSLDAAAATGLTGIREKQAIQTGRIGAQNQSCEMDSKNCILVFKKKGANDFSQLAYSSIIPQSVAFVNGVKDYADALDALEKADAQADVQSAFGKGMGAMAVVATAVNQPAGAALAALSTPLTSAAGWGFGQYQNGIKLDALQKATSAADSIIQAAAPTLTAEFDFGNVARLQELKADLDAKEDAFDASPTLNNLNSAIAAANLFDAAVRAQPGSVIASMADAHHKLTLAVAHPDIGFASAVASISALAQQAQNLEQIAKQLGAAQPATKK